MFRKFGNSFFRIQHAQIRLDDISEHFYQKMHSHVAFCVISSSLLLRRLSLVPFLSIAQDSAHFFLEIGSLQIRPINKMVAIFQKRGQENICPFVSIFFYLYLKSTHMLESSHFFVIVTSCL